jgi:hypothetical protein
LESLGKGRGREAGVEELEGWVWCISCDFGGKDKERGLTGSADILLMIDRGGNTPDVRSDVR